MKLCLLLLAIFASLTNVVLTSEYDDSPEKQAETNPNLNKDGDAGNPCFEEFASKKPSLLKDFQTQTLECIEKAKERSESDVKALNDFNSEAETKVKDFHESFKNCNLKEQNSEYFECLKNFDSETRKILDDIKGQVETVANRLTEGENDKNSCLNQTIEDNNDQIRSSLTDFQNCVSEGSSPASPSSTNELDKVFQIYSTLETCVRKLKSDEDEVFDDCWKKIEIDAELQEYMVRNGPNLFEKLTEKDRKEDACLRQFMTRYVYQSFKYDFDFEKCMKKGGKKATSKESGDEMVLDNYSNIHSLLTSCRVNSNESDISECISKVLTKSRDVSSISFYSHMMSDNYLKKMHEKILATYKNDETCMGYVFESLQFKGLFMKDSVRENLKECFTRVYFSNPTPPSTEDVLKRLKIIEDEVFYCTKTSSKSKLPQCIGTAVQKHSSSLDYIIASPLYDKQYKNRISRHDGQRNTCFARLISDNKAKSYGSVENCFKSHHIF